MRAKKGWKVLLLLTVVLCGLVVLGFIPAIPQNSEYHQFADTRVFFGIRNFWNVMSNAGFIIVGLFGITKITQLKGSPLRPGYSVFCFSVVMIGFGSAYYHYAPTTASLVWDRLPMAVAFMALLSIVVTDGVSRRAGKILLMPFILAGIASIVYWHVSEMQGAGDLRFYGFVQALPVVLIPLIIVLFGLKQLNTKLFWWTFAFYLMAKLAEHLDQELFDLMQVISGHSLKHILAALAVLWAVLAFSSKAESRMQKLLSSR